MTDKVKRYNFGYKPACRLEPGRYGPVEAADGLFVYHSDYAALERRLAELESLLNHGRGLDVHDTSQNNNSH